ncbi:TRAP transporter small permease [Ottowia sp. VDI28]|uniref:TRAP transporter small permease n=1 Tax=Ottowia sp. VDI28 TaxID=3133968 RepID=UPI003C30C404
MNALLKWCTSCSRWLAWFGGLALLLSAALISLDVIFRAIWKTNYFESFELSTYAFAIATAMGMSYALVSKAHIRIELLYVKLPPPWRAWLDVWSYLGLAVVSLALVYWCAQTVMGNLDTGARSNTSLAIPLAVPQGLWLLGLSWLAVVSTLYALFGLIKVLTGRSKEAGRKLGMATLQEEIEAGLGKEKT